MRSERAYTLISTPHWAISRNGVTILSKPTIESLRRYALNANELFRTPQSKRRKSRRTKPPEHFLDPNAKRIHTIDNNNIRWPAALGRLSTDKEIICLDYRDGSQQKIALAWVWFPILRNYRPWLTCPNCQRRLVYLLWGKEIYTAAGSVVTRFACRHCLKATYACRTKSTKKRRKDRHEQALQRVGVTHGQPATVIRPLGMRRKDFKLG
jgi:hypothetical protein